MSDARQIPPRTLALQALASDPAASAWVSANAGSGKTHVLAQRVIRLLLQGVSPGRILCLTFTKAAAANMSERVFRQLAQWSALDDTALAAAIAATGAPKPQSADELAFARKLFARAVETPGGLKIQTLHAFCERVLHAAPFEANVAAGFSIIEETAQAQLIARAKFDVLHQAERDPDLAAALDLVAEEAGLVFDGLLKEALGQRALFRAARAPGAAEQLREALGLGPRDTPAMILRDMLEGGLAPKTWPDFAALLKRGTATDAKKAGLFTAAHAAWRAGKTETAQQNYFEIFFNEKGEGAPAKTLLNSGLSKSRPDIKQQLEAEQNRLITLREKMTAAEAAARTFGLGALVNAILDRYERLKAERQWLDFDDLIARTRNLLTRSSARWVLYKLDAGIDHILVDEAQDTSIAQWDILQRIAGDFFSGEGQNARQRSFFAVGDEKQSIFSFQGAAPKLFAEMQSDFGRRAREAQSRFEPVALNLSFRSAPGVLAAVDKVFALPNHYRGLSAQADSVGPVHEALKREAPARVEIWDVIAPTVAPEQRDWKLPLDFQDEADPPIAAARRIAAEIARWLAPGSTERVEDKGQSRPIRAGDIMILVRRRDAFFEAMIRALKEVGAPVAGADRLDLGKHIAVMDLVAIGRAALLPEDDLTLAVALKTPIFGFDDEDLLAVAPNRPGTLFAALQAAPDARMQEACARVALLGKMGRALPPFAFFARLLGPQGGRKAFLARLGPEAGDALDEFLSLAMAHERARAPSLPAFLAEIEALDMSIKRDMDSGGGYVRVMTAHAAKGLEAKIVFLPDVCAAPGGQHDARLFALETPGGELLAWSPKAKKDCGAIALARAEKRENAADEYRRLLYVAMTRAEERLYIAGHRGKREFGAESWRGMIETALIGESVEFAAPWNADETVLRFGEVLAAEAPSPVAVLPVEAAKPEKLPDWLFAPAPAEAAPPPPLRPSSALQGAEDFFGASTLAPQRAAALAEGRQLHRLLQFLPEIATPLRKDAALRDCAAQGFAETETQKLAEQALAVLHDARLAPLFSENSLAEARIAASLTRANGEKLDLVGVIDRLAETPEEVLLVDYKTGGPGKAMASHVTQMALYRAAVAPLYPNKPVRCFLIYTQGPKIEEILAQDLDAAFAVAIR